MKNKRGGVLAIIVIVILAILMGSIVVNVVGSLIDDFKDYGEYKEFCENHAEFCYCEGFSCEFKTQWSSLDGLSKETREFCEIAEELEDKSMLFKAGCYQ